jgi:tight adherence protein C
VTAAMLVGLLAGSGLVLLVSGLVPSPAPLADELAALHRRPALRAAGVDERRRISGSIGRRLVETVVGRRVIDRCATDLRATGTTASAHLGQRAALALTGLLWAPLTATLMWLAGADLGLTLPLWVSSFLAPLGFLYPSLALRASADARRRTFRHALSAFLDIVSISLAGGRGVDTALRDGAEAGQGWPFEEIRSALLEAQLRGDSPWAGLAALGEALDIPELGELAASAALAGSEGARVRTSLSAKARSLRLRGLTDVEAAAQSASELMSLPVVLLMFGFVIFLGYPAVDRVLQGI